MSQDRTRLLAHLGELLDLVQDCEEQARELGFVAVTHDCVGAHTHLMQARRHCDSYIAVAEGALVAESEKADKER